MAKKRKRRHTYARITKDTLAELFCVSVYTVENWIWKKKLDPTNILDIIDKYNNKWKLDLRRKENSLDKS